MYLPLCIYLDQEQDSAYKLLFWFVWWRLLLVFFFLHTIYQILFGPK